MLLVNSKVVVLSEDEIKDAILSLIFKKAPELRPAGVTQDKSASKVEISISSDRIISARYTIESESKEVYK